MPQDKLAFEKELTSSSGTFRFYSLQKFSLDFGVQIGRLPFSLRILLENLLRHWDNKTVTEKETSALIHKKRDVEIPFRPGRILLQDFTGVPVVVDLAAMRDALKALGGDPKKINPIIPIDLVIDHSVQVDSFGNEGAFSFNVKMEFDRNRERYAFLRWAQKSFTNFTAVPPGTGICHQVNLEYLAKVVQTKKISGQTIAFPDSVFGTDSHTTMINGLGVFGWGVGGIEAEAAMLGQPYSMLVPEVVGVKLTGEMPPGATATDLVLTLTQTIRKKGVVGKFVEFCGPGMASLALADRATLANMAPEYGATMGFFPADEETLRYLKTTGRETDLVERYLKEQDLFRTNSAPEPIFDDQLEVDLSQIEPCLAGPKRPQDRVPLTQSKEAFWQAFKSYFPEGQAPTAKRSVSVQLNQGQDLISDGSVVIAAITSCTNTSNPSVMLGAGLLAKKAVQAGLKVSPLVKTSLAPGSRVVTDYLKQSGLLPYLEKLGFYIVGYGCTTCIGNSGPLPETVVRAIKENNLVAAAILSGNRNFEGRVNPHTKANYLASPPLVVAYALAGRVDINLQAEPLGQGKDGSPVYLKDIWPKEGEILEAAAQFVKPQMFHSTYAEVFKGDEDWQALPTPEGDLYQWDKKSTYIQNPPFFDEIQSQSRAQAGIEAARALAVLGDSVTTDHISPAGNIPADGPAGQYLIAQGVAPKDFNSFGARRGNHKVMMRGTFANIRIKNFLVAGTEGGWTLHLPDGEKMTIYDAAMKYKKENVPLIVIAGKEYGSGSSRDWAAKGPALLGVKAVIAESYERIHRSNLVGMGVLPLEFKPGENKESLGLTGRELYSIVGLDSLAPKKEVSVEVTSDNGSISKFSAILRLDSATEIEYYKNGGILQTVLKQF